MTGPAMLRRARALISPADAEAMRARLALATALACALVLGACAGDSDDDAADGGPDGGSDTTAPDGPDEEAEPATAPATHCPEAYQEDGLEAGHHTRFESAGQQREMHLLLPEDLGEPRPVFVALTGTVQSEPDFLAQSRLDELVDEGWIVVAPVRNDNGLIWPPWDGMRSAGTEDQPNPDLEFLDDVVDCLGAHLPVDQDRIFIGGISIGGTMVNYVLQRRSDVYAGGIVGSGNYLTTEPVDPEPLDDMAVIVAWGGESDVWSGCADGAMGEDATQDSDEELCVDEISFVEDAARASQRYDGAPDVAQVACHMDIGHIWLSDATHYFAEILYDHPKGTDGPIELPDGKPEDLTCTTDAFVAE